MRTLARIVGRPLRDWLAALDACVRDEPGARIAIVAATLLISWWLYVPVHELLHAWGCRLSGGDVTRLEIDWIYGGSPLAWVFPYVTVGSRYAGRLSGFDTHGSDLVYLATDALPFALTVFVGVPWLRAAARGGRRGSALLGASLPLAFAPFVSLTGDYYEMGAILVSRLVAARVPGFPVDRWRGDDLFALGRALAGHASAADVAGVTASLAMGGVLAFATYWAGLLVASACAARATRAARA